MVTSVVQSRFQIQSILSLQREDMYQDMYHVHSSSIFTEEAIAKEEEKEEAPPKIKRFDCEEEKKKNTKQKFGKKFLSLEQRIWKTEEEQAKVAEHTNGFVEKIITAITRAAIQTSQQKQTKKQANSHEEQEIRVQTSNTTSNSERKEGYTERSTQQNTRLFFHITHSSELQSEWSREQQHMIREATVNIREERKYRKYRTSFRKKYKRSAHKEEYIQNAIQCEKEQQKEPKKERQEYSQEFDQKSYDTQGEELQYRVLRNSNTRLKIKEYIKEQKGKSQEDHHKKTNHQKATTYKFTLKVKENPKREADLCAVVPEYEKTAQGYRIKLEEVKKKKEGEEKGRKEYRRINEYKKNTDSYRKVRVGDAEQAETVKVREDSVLADLDARIQAQGLVAHYKKKGKQITITRILGCQENVYAVLTNKTTGVKTRITDLSENYNRETHSVELYTKGEETQTGSNTTTSLLKDKKATILPEGYQDIITIKRKERHEKETYKTKNQRAQKAYAELTQLELIDRALQADPRKLKPVYKTMDVIREGKSVERHKYLADVLDKDGKSIKKNSLTMGFLIEELDQDGKRYEAKDRQGNLLPSDKALARSDREYRLVLVEQGVYDRRPNRNARNAAYKKAA